jgi:tetratricopeptide (TPR) repeat protein
LKTARLWLALFLGAVPAIAQEQDGRLDRVVLADSVARAIDQARSALAAGELETAVDDYRRAQGLLGLDILYGDAGDPDPLSAAIARGLAEAYLALGDPYAAAVEAERGTALEDEDARLWTLLGLARYRLADIAAAAVAFDRALALDDDEADAHWGLGLVAIAENRPEEAVARAERALELRPESDYALTLARWAETIGEHGRALAALDRWLELRPDDPEVEGYRNLRLFYALLARGPTAVLDPRTTRVQLGFDLKSGDEIPYVSVRFNGAAPVYVLFDTGAERNVLDRGYAEEIGITLLPGGRLHGAYRPSPGGYALVDSLTVGSATLSRVPFAVGDFGALSLRGQGAYYIAGVVNPALLFRDFVVALDYGRRRIELIRRGVGAETYLARPTTLRRSKAPFVFDVNGVWPVVRVQLNGSPELPLLVDTGASDLLISRQAAGALRLDPLRFEASLGGYRREALRGILLDGPPAEGGGIALQGILGYPFFRGARVTFDYHDMVVLIEN